MRSDLAPVDPPLRRVIGLPSAVMLAVGGTIGVGIFVNPAVVARSVSAPGLIVAAWVLGGLIAMAGALTYAELGRRMPETGGEYVYIRQAWGPLAGFLFGWTSLLVVQTGGLAAVTIVFAKNLDKLAGGALNERLVVIAVLALMAAVNCAGVKVGNSIQGLLTLVKCVGIAALVAIGLVFIAPATPVQSATAGGGAGLKAFGAALIPVVFSYGGWQTASFVAGEMREAPRVLARGLVAGVAIVIALYLLVNFACLRAMGPALGATLTPAADVLRRGFGPAGGAVAEAAVALSALAFISQSMLTSPRVSYAMARDGLFFRALAHVGEGARTPAPAIMAQAVWTGVLALSGRYDQLLSFTVSMNYLFFALTAASLLRLPRRAGDGPVRACAAGFLAASIVVIVNAFWSFPVNSAVGYLILAAGIAPYLFWRGRARLATAAA